MNVVLEARGLNKNFGALKVTNDVDLCVGEGARLALVGPNGAGKSTLVGLLTGQLRPTSGAVFLNGRDVTGDSAARRTRKGLVRTFQINNLFRGLTVLENAVLAVGERTGASWNFWRPAGRNRQVIEEAAWQLERLGLVPHMHSRVSELAYGQQRLVEIAIALSLDPKVLLLDEPAAGIPSGEVGLFMDVVESLPPELSIVMIEHDMHVVRRFAREVAVLVAGSILMQGAPQTVMCSEEVRRVYLGGLAPVEPRAEAAHA